LEFRGDMSDMSPESTSPGRRRQSYFVKSESVIYMQWLKWFCEAGGSPDEARLEQTPYPSNPTNLALFRHKITLYRFNPGGLILLQGAQMGAGVSPPSPPHVNHCTYATESLSSLCVALRHVCCG